MAHFTLSLILTGINIAVCIINIMCIVMNKQEETARQKLRHIKCRYPDLDITMKELEDKQKPIYTDVICIGTGEYHNDNTMFWGDDQSGNNIRLTYFLDMNNNFYSTFSTQIFQTVTQKDIENRTKFEAMIRNNKVVKISRKQESVG